MKKTLFTAFLLVCTLGSNAQEINWISLEQATALQKTAPKKIMMDVYTKWCGPCKLLDKKTFHNKDVVAYINQNFYAVKFNAEGNKDIQYKGKVYKNPGYNPAKANRRNSGHQLASLLQVRAYPTIVFFDETGDVIAPIKGYQTPQQLEFYLKMFVKNEHIDMDTQEKFKQYHSAFKATFKG